MTGDPQDSPDSADLADPPVPTWAEVISSFETQVDQADALVEPGLALVAPPATVIVADVVAFHAWPHAPEPAGDELAQLRALHARQRATIARLHDSMAAIRQQQALLDAPSEPRRSVFVDQRA